MHTCFHHRGAENAEKDGDLRHPPRRRRTPSKLRIAQMTDKAILHDRVREALDAAGAEYEVLACEPHLADTAEFCAHYGIPAEQACHAILVVLNTTPRRYVACLVRPDTRL